jgi:hypothetical protein
MRSPPLARAVFVSQELEKPMTYPNDAAGGMREVAEDLQNDARTCEPSGAPLTQPSSGSVLTAIRGKVRRAPEGVRKEKLGLMAAMLDNGVPAPYLDRQVEVMSRRYQLLRAEERHMGVDRTDYLMFATEIGADDFDRDNFEAEIDGAPGRRFDVVYDGMSGRYSLAGKIVAKSDPYEGFEMAKIDPAAFAFDSKALAAAVSDAFGRDLTTSDFSLILFSHFH